MDAIIRRPASVGEDATKDRQPKPAVKRWARQDCHHERGAGSRTNILRGAQNDSLGGCSCKVYEYLARLLRNDQECCQLTEEGFLMDHFSLTTYHSLQFRLAQRRQVAFQLRRVFVGKSQSDIFQRDLRAALQDVGHGGLRFLFTP